MRQFTILICLFILPQLSWAQNENTNGGRALLFNFTYAFQQPAFDLKERFGPSNEIGANIDFLSSKNYIFGLRGSFLFGNEVKEDVLASLRDFNGDIIGRNQAIANVVLRERGFYLGGHIGKLFPILKNNKRSGIRVTLGMGLLQHKIRIQDDADTAIQLSGDYAKGYDRLSNGIAFDQFIGYQHLSKNRRANFFAGVELTQAFTQNRRAFDFDTMMKDDRQRFDFLYAFKIGWTVFPFYLDDISEDIYY